MSHLRNPKPITDSKEFVKRMRELRSQTISAQALAEAQHIVDVENSFDDMLLEEHYNSLANSDLFTLQLLCHDVESLVPKNECKRSLKKNS